VAIVSRRWQRRTPDREVVWPFEFNESTYGIFDKFDGRRVGRLMWGADRDRDRRQVTTTS
jgi:hypothetical protein